VPAHQQRARDFKLLDLIDGQPRHRYDGAVWRAARDGRDPLQGSRSNSRWCNGNFDVLYTSLERNGAIAELYSLLSLQPVFPSKVTFKCYELYVQTAQSLKILELADLASLGIDVNRYKDREYTATQAVADAAFFLGFDGLLLPSARWACANAILFTDRISPDKLTIHESKTSPIDWAEWRRSTRR
jgi:hypothetical protein